MLVNDLTGRWPNAVAGTYCDGRYAVLPRATADRWEMWQRDGDGWKFMGTATENDARRWAINGDTLGQLDLFAEVPA